LSSSRRKWRRTCARPSLRFVPVRLILEAPPETTEDLVREVAQGGVMVVAGGSPAVVVRPRSRRLGEHRERPPVAGVTEALVAHAPRIDEAAAARGARDRRRPGEGAQALRACEPAGIITHLGEHPGG